VGVRKKERGTWKGLTNHPADSSRLGRLSKVRGAETEVGGRGNDSAGLGPKGFRRRVIACCRGEGVSDSSRGGRQRSGKGEKNNGGPELCKRGGVFRIKSRRR